MSYEFKILKYSNLIHTTTSFTLHRLLKRERFLIRNKAWELYVFKPYFFIDANLFNKLM